jgi:3-hydroxyisobutyrate dehydrogenase
MGRRAVVTPTVAVLGTGIMGFPMARNLAAAGFAVRAWNRTVEKAQPLEEHGATVATTAAEAARGADVAITMLPDAGVVASAMDGDEGGLAGMDGDAIWVQMSTVGVQGTDRLVAMAQERGVGFVDAPVLGSRQPAEEGKLVVFASGAPELRERVDPVFDTLGQKTLWVGDQPGAGSRLKLVTNHWLIGLVENLAETIALAQALDVDPHDFLDAIKGGPTDSPYAEQKTEAILNDDFSPAFPLRLARKDLGLALDAAREAGLDLPVLEAARRQFDTAIAQGHADEDLVATYKASAPNASGR